MLPANERRMPGPHSHRDTEPENVAAYLRLKVVRERGPGRTTWQKSGGRIPSQEVNHAAGKRIAGNRINAHETRGDSDRKRADAATSSAWASHACGLHVSGRHRERQCMPQGKTIAPSERGIFPVRRWRRRLYDPPRRGGGAFRDNNRLRTGFAAPSLCLRGHVRRIVHIGTAGRHDERRGSTIASGPRAKV